MNVDARQNLQQLRLGIYPRPKICLSEARVELHRRLVLGPQTERGEREGRCCDGPAAPPKWFYPPTRKFALSLPVHG